MGGGASVSTSKGDGDFLSNLRIFNDECMSVLDMLNPFQLGTSEAHWLGDRIESCSEYNNTLKPNSFICSPDGLFILYRAPDDMDFSTTGLAIHLKSLKWIRLENFRVCADEEVTSSSGLHILPTDHYGVRATKDGEKIPFKNSFDITELVRNELVDSKANNTVVFRFSGPFTPQMMSGNPDMSRKIEQHTSSQGEKLEGKERKGKEQSFDEGVEQTFSALYFFEYVLHTHHKIHLYHSVMYMESIRLNKSFKKIEKANECLKVIKEVVNKYDTSSIHASFHSKRSDTGSKIISLLEGEGKEEMTEIIRKSYQESLLQPFHEGVQSNTFVELKRLSAASADDAKGFVDLTKKNSIDEVMEKVRKLCENGGELKVAGKSVDRYLQLKLHDEGFEGELYTAEYARREKLIEINIINESEEFLEEWVTMQDSDEDILRFKQRRNIMLKEQKDLNKKVLAHTDPEASSEVNEFRNALKKTNKEIKAVVEETGNINDLTNWRKKDLGSKLLDGTDQFKQISADDYAKFRSGGSQSANYKSELFHINQKAQQKQQQIASMIEESDEVFDQSVTDARFFDMFDRFAAGRGGSGGGGSSIGKGGGGSITSDSIQMEGGSSNRSSSMQIDGSFREPDFGIPSEGQKNNRSFHDIFHPERNSSITGKNTNLVIDKYDDVVVDYFDDKSLSRSKLKINPIDDKMSVIIDHEVSIVSKKSFKSVSTYDNLNLEQYNEYFKNRSVYMKNSSYAKRSLSVNTVKNQNCRVNVTSLYKSLRMMIKGELIMMVVMGGITAGLTVAMNKIETVDMTVIKGGGKSMDSQTKTGAILQHDGNFVHYVKGKEADWSSNDDNSQYKDYMNKEPKGPFTLQVKNSREVVLYPSETPENILWRMTVDGDQHKGFQLKSGGRLHKDNFLLSKDGRFKLFMHEYGNLVLYRIPFESSIKLVNKDLYQNACKNWGPCVFPLWSSNTDNILGDPRMVLQDDGNMILERDEDIFHGSGPIAYFDSGSHNLPGAEGPYTLTLEDTGDVITRDKNQRIVMWISPSSSSDGRLSSGSILPNGGYLFSQNGKFVLRFENGMVAIYRVPSYRNPIFSCGFMTDKTVFNNGYMTTDGDHINLTYPKANGLMVCPSTARLQIVGDYALKGADGETKDVEVIAWQSELPSKLPSSTYLELTNDGYLTIKDSSDDSIIWMNWYRYVHTLLEEHDVQVLLGIDQNTQNKAYHVDYALKDMTISNNCERMLRSPKGFYRLVLDRGHLIVYDGHDRPHIVSLSPGEESGAFGEIWMETLGIGNKSPIYGLLYQARCAIGRAMDEDWSIKTDTGDDYYDNFWLANSLIPYSRKSYCVLQDDGNLVIYRPWEVNQKKNRVGGLFSSNSAGNTSKSDGPFKLALWDNGSLHIYDRHKKSIWSFELNQIHMRTYVFDPDYNGPGVQDDVVAKVLKYKGRLNLIRSV